MHVDAISIELSILYFKGLLVKISIKQCISVPEAKEKIYVCFGLHEILK